MAREGIGERDVHVLHVDDDSDFADLTATILEREMDRITVATAAAASEGLDRLHEASFDCVVSDHEMPGMNGLEFLEAVREDHPELPFVLFTGRGSEEIASRAISAGVTDYLQKTPGTDQYAVLANRIRNAVDGHRARRRAALVDRQLRRVYDRVTDAVLAVDADWRYTYANEEAERLLDRPHDELVGERVWDTFPGLVDTPFEDALRTAMETQETVSVQEYYPALDSWFDTRVYPDDEGISIYFRDVADERESELEHQFFEQLVHELGIGVGVYAADGRFVQVNEAFADLLGTDVETLRRTPVWEVDAKLSTGEFDDHWESFAEDETRVVETTLRRADGTVLPVEVVTTCRRIDGTRYHFGTVRDVAERTAEEEALRRYETLVEEMNEAVFMYDSEGVCTFVNEAGVAGTSFSREELVGGTVRRLAELGLIDDEEQLDRHAALIDDLLAGEREEAEQTVELSVSGREWPLIADVHLSRVDADDGTVLGVVGVSRDVTEQVHHERELTARTVAMEEATDGIAILDPDGEYAYVNRAHVDVYGFDDGDELLGESWRLCYADDQVDRFEAEVMPVLVEAGSWRGEATGVRRDGSTFPQELSLTQLDDGRIVCVVRDITERKERERELRETTRRLQGVLDTVSVALFMKDDDGRYLLMNQECRELLGLGDDEEYVGKTDHDLLPDEAAADYRADDRRVLETGETIEVEEEVPAPWGTRVHLTRKTPILDETGEPYAVCGVSTDITERKERQRELERQNERLEEFAGIVSHDLRNPLEVAMGSLELAREDCECDHLDDVRWALDRMDQLIDRTLTLARSGRTIGDTQPVHLESVARTCWGNVDTADAEVRIEDVEEIAADPDRLRHLFENLFRNAIEHGGTDATVRVGPLDGGFYVEDDGQGIDADGTADLFDAGYTTAADGPGLGLTIVERIVDAHGWEVAATEAEGGGARFEITGVKTASASVAE